MTQLKPPSSGDAELEEDEQVRRACLDRYREPRRFSNVGGGAGGVERPEPDPDLGRAAGGQQPAAQLIDLSELVPAGPTGPTRGKRRWIGP